MWLNENSKHKNKKTFFPQTCNILVYPNFVLKQSSFVSFGETALQRQSGSHLGTIKVEKKMCVPPNA